MKSFRIMGRPWVSASAIVPGPAYRSKLLVYGLYIIRIYKHNLWNKHTFVMMQSQAPMYFSISGTYPSTYIKNPTLENYVCIYIYHTRNEFT